MRPILSTNVIEIGRPLFATFWQTFNCGLIYQTFYFGLMALYIIPPTLGFIGTCNLASLS